MNLRLVLALFLLVGPAWAEEEESEASWSGPGKFCAYSAIIDLAPDQNVVPHIAGIHEARFTWRGNFGELDVQAIGWASKPKGLQLSGKTPKGHVQFAERQINKNYEVAIWNEKNGAVYFRSKQPISPDQRAAIGQVDLFDESDPEPENCEYRMMFAWE